MKARISASVLAVGLVFGLAGCGMVTPVATNISYDASDGVSANLGDVAVRNLMVITGDTEYGTDNGSLVFTAINSSKEDRRIKLQFEGASGTQNIYVDVAAGQTLVLGVGDVKPIELKGIDTPAGSMLEMYLQSGDAEGQTVNVPVLDTTLIEYQDLAR